MSGGDDAGFSEVIVVTTTILLGHGSRRAPSPDFALLN